MTDINSSEFQSASSRFSDDNNSSFILNQSNVPMDIDLDDDEIISTKFNGYRSSSIENENKEDVFHQGNPVLNKSFDILPEIKDDDPSSDNSIKNTNVLDTTVELPNNNDELDVQTMLSNQFSLEYPYEIPQPVKNIRSSSPPSPANPIETVTTLTKNMKLNVNKTLEEQEPSTTDKTFDTNTFVLKKKERRKVITPATEHSFNTTSEAATPPDLCNTKSPFNTPSTSLDIVVASRPATSQQQQQQQQQQQPSFTDPTRIM